MWDQKYATEQYVYGTEPNEFLAEHVRLLPKGRILSLAEGEGRNAVYLAKQGFKVTAVDSSRVGLDKARKLAEENRVDIEFIHNDLEHFELGKEQWDGIVSIFCHVPPKLRKTLHGKIINGLKHQGVLILEAYTPDQLKHGTGGPPVVDLMMDADSLEQELSGLRFEHLVEVERNVQEGFGHSGTGAVVQIIGYKN